MNYEAERAMNQKRLRMEGEPGHGVVQGNGLPLNYIDNGHQISYQPYAGAYNAHYPPPDAFAAYGAGGYPQSLPYAPPAHQNYAHHQFPQQQMHMPQSHMAFVPVQGYGEMHKGWALGALDAKPLDVKHKEIKLEPADAHKRPHPEPDMVGDLDQPKIKIKTDIFKPDDLAHRPIIDKPIDVLPKPIDITQKPADLQNKADVPPVNTTAEKPADKPAEACKPEGASEGAADAQRPPDCNTKPPEKSDEERKPFSSPDLPTSGTMPGKVPTPMEPKKRGRPKGSTNKPKMAGAPGKLSPGIPTPPALRGPAPRPPAPAPRPRAPGYQYNVRPFRKDFSGIQFRRRWSDDCLDSSHIPNEVYFGDVPVSTEVLFNYYDAHAERSRLAAAAAHLAAQKAAAAKLQAARGPPRLPSEVTTVDSSSSDESSGSSGSNSDDSDDDSTPIKRGPGRPKGTKNTPRPPGTPKPPGTPGTGKRGRPPVPPELRTPGITEMKKFCKAAGIRFDYKKLTEDCTKNKERVQKMMDLLIEAGLEGKPSIDKCRDLKKAKTEKKEKEKQAKKEAKAKHKDERSDSPGGEESGGRRMTRGATGVKPRQRIVISSDEEDDTPAARRTLSKLRSSVNDTDSD